MAVRVERSILTAKSFEMLRGTKTATKMLRNSFAVTAMNSNKNSVNIYQELKQWVAFNTKGIVCIITPAHDFFDGVSQREMNQLVWQILFEDADEAVAFKMAWAGRLLEGS